MIMLCRYIKIVHCSANKLLGYIIKLENYHHTNLNSNHWSKIHRVFKLLTCQDEIKDQIKG